MNLIWGIVTMMKARGIFDGKNIVLLEPVNLPADTAVEVTIHPLC